MVNLPQLKSDDSGDSGSACGTTCGNGLEKIYPYTAIRYGAMRWVGEFSYKPGSVFTCGRKVVIQTDRGIELGEQVSLTCNGCSKSISRDQIKDYVNNSGPEFYRLRSGRILREADAQDVGENDRLNARVREDIDKAALLAAQLNLDMKIITAEHLLGGERIVFYFRSESRVDFRELVRELAHEYQTRIELRQVGARDEARLVADYEICGRECCCRNFLKKMRPVTMKMAKLQKSTLDPTKVSGRCGRLRCCLRYEHEGYEQLAAKLPRVGSTVETEYGPARVIDRQILTQLVMIRTQDEREIVIPLEEIGAAGGPRPERPGDAQRPADRGFDAAAAGRFADAVEDAGTQDPADTTGSDEAPAPDSADEMSADRPRERRRRRRRGDRPKGPRPALPPENRPAAPEPGAAPAEPDRPRGRGRRGRRRRRGRNPDGGAGPPPGGE